MRLNLTTIALITLTGSNSVYAASGFDFDEALVVSQSLPKINDLINTTANAGNSTSATATFTDGKDHTLASADGSTTLSALTSRKKATLLVDGKQVVVKTTAPSLSDAYSNSSAPYAFTVSTVVEGRPWELQWSDALDSISSSNVYNVRINGEQFTITLPTGTTLSDLSSTTRITITDANGVKIIDNTLINSITNEDMAELGKRLVCLILI